MSSTNHECKRIEAVLGRMLKGGRIACTWQMDTRDYLVTIEMRQRIRTFRLTSAEAVRPNWHANLIEQINKWFNGKIVA